MKKKIRNPVVAGRFYTGNAQALQQEIDRYLQEVPDLKIAPMQIFGLISPHAGYACSAPVAAFGYKLLKQHSCQRAVVISPSHSDYFTGVSVYDGDAYATPLGEIAVDKSFSEQLVAKSSVAEFSEAGHRAEHALEVQLPFLQVVFPDGVKLVPITVGVTSSSDLSEFSAELAPLIDPDNTIIIASSDLSHYYPEAVAHQKDKFFIELLEKYDLTSLSDGYDDQSLEACGLGPILVLMQVAKRLGNPQCRVLDYRTSGDTCADRQQVVGYASAVVYK